MRGAGIGGRLPVFVHCAASSGLAQIMGGRQRDCGRRAVSAAEGIPSFPFPFLPSPRPARRFRCVCEHTESAGFVAMAVYWKTHGRPVS